MITLEAVDAARADSLRYHSNEWYPYPYMVDDGLTPAQRQVFAAIRDRVERGEPVPTYRELCQEFRWSSTGTVRDHLQALERKGFLQRSGPGHRQIRLLREQVPVTRVPLLGRVVAGSPMTAEEHVDGYLPVPAEWTAGGNHFAVRVDGTSMAGAGILDGDFAIARQQAVAGQGDVVVATVDGKTTLKRFTRNASGVTLAAENPRHRSIPVRTEDARVQGVVVGLLRAYRRAGATQWTEERVGDLTRRRR